MTKKHIVLVTRWFYPENNVATNRMNAFAKYLDRDRFELAVIGFLEEEMKPQSTDFDATVYREKGGGLMKTRRQKRSDGKFVHNLKSVNNILVSRIKKEEYPGWARNVGKRLTIIHKETPIDLIISSYGPMDAHLGALKFLRKVTEKPKWILDMRDEMSTNPFLSDRKKKEFEHFERSASKFASGVTTVSMPIVEAFKKTFPNVDCIEVRNGFDHSEVPLDNFNDVFTLLYAGSFYGERKPNTFFEALLELKAEGQLPEKWVFKLLGTNKNFKIPTVLAPHLQFVPPCENSQAVREMFKADCNVLIHPPMGVKGVYTGKLFEYVSAHKPILGILDPKDVAADLILEHKAGFIADFYTIPEIKTAFLEAYACWASKRRLPFDPIQTATLHRKHQVKVLETLITKLLSE